MGNKIAASITSNLRKPTTSITGRFVIHRLKKINKFLSQNAVSLCEIQPNHQVLELGFGPGIGLQSALQIVTEGSGKVYGVDFSPFMVNMCSRQLSSHIAADKLKLLQCGVENMPFNNDQFDRVFHCNCFYFWEDMSRCCREVYRVMKPHSLMVTTLNLQSLQLAKEKGVLKNYRTDPLEYMSHLEHVGFTNVHIKYLNDSGKDYQAIFASIEEKG